LTLLWYLLSLHDRILHQQHVVATVVRMNRDFEISTLHTSCQSKCRRRILQLEEFSRLGLVVKVNRSVNQHSAHEPAHLFHVDQLCPFVRLRVIALDRAENCLVLAKAAAHIFDLGEQRRHNRTLTHASQPLFATHWSSDSSARQC